MNFDQAAQDAQATGAARTADYTNKANDFAGQYSNYQNQSNAANQNIQNQNAYMQGAGSANNLYNNAFDQQSLKSGYNLGNMQSAQNNLAQAQGSQSAYNDFANTAASKWGLNAGGFAAANAGATQSLNNNIQSAGAAVGKQQQNFLNAQTGANQQAGLGLQQQSMQLQGYQNAFGAAMAQQKQASDNMNTYQQMAQAQGGLTATQVQGYQQSKALSASAQASIAAAQDSIAHAQQLTYQTNVQKAKDAADTENANKVKQAGVPNATTSNTYGVLSPETYAAQAAKDAAASQSSAQSGWRPFGNGAVSDFLQPMSSAFSNAKNYLFGQ